MRPRSQEFQGPGVATPVGAPRTFNSFARRASLAAVAASLTAGALFAQTEAPSAPPADPAPAEQPAPEPAAPAPVIDDPVAREEAARREAERIDLAIAWRLARLALSYLRTNPDPHPDDYHIAALLLGEARRRAPRDEELLRRQIEAWHAAGLSDKVIEGTRELLTIAPDDTVAQLRLIAARLRAIQDADARIASYDRLLGPAGQALHPTIRSRLALDDALLSRERGDDDRFLKRLLLATQLDPTNKDAAIVAANYSLPNLTDPLARVELLANVVLADPLDRASHLNLARELLRHGAFEAADRFLTRAIDLYLVLPPPMNQPDPDVFDDLFVTQWGAGGADAILDQCNTDEAIQKDRVAKMQAYLSSIGEDPNQAVYQPNARLEKLRVVCAAAAGREEEAQASAVNVVLAFREYLLFVAEAIKEGGKDLTPEQAAEARAQAMQGAQEARTEWMWLCLWSGRTLDVARELFDYLAPLLSDEARALYEGWLAIREGAPADGVRILTPLADVDVRARMGLGVAAEALGDPRSAVRLYARIALDRPGETFGLWARTRIEKILGEKVNPTETAAALNAYAARLPRQLDEMTREPRSFAYLEATILEHDSDPLGRTLLRIRLKNIGSIPLGLGPSSPLNSSMLLVPRMVIDGQRAISRGSPDVAAMDRRFALRPGETLDITAWADQGETGLLLDEYSVLPVTMRWRVVQGFIPTTNQQEGARYFAGPLCLETETAAEVRARVPLPGEESGSTATDETRVIAERLIAELPEAKGERLLGLLTYARRRLTRSASVYFVDNFDQEWRTNYYELLPQQKGPLWRLPEENRYAVALEKAAASRVPVAQAVAARWPTMTEDERLFAALVLQPTRVIPEARVIDDAIRADPARSIRLVSMVTRESETDSPAFQESLKSGDPLLSEVARLLIRRWGKGRAPIPDEEDPAPLISSPAGPVPTPPTEFSPIDGAPLTPPAGPR